MGLKGFLTSRSLKSITIPSAVEEKSLLTCFVSPFLFLYYSLLRLQVFFCIFSAVLIIVLFFIRNCTHWDGEQTEEEFTLIGMLMKRRGGVSRHIGQRWVNRCFALKDGKLVYFESDTLSEVDWANPRGVLDLTAPDVTFLLNRPFENAPTQHTLQVNVNSKPGMRWKLCAFTESELQSWAAEIRKYCQLHSEAQLHSESIVTSPRKADETETLSLPASPSSKQNSTIGFGAQENCEPVISPNQKLPSQPPSDRRVASRRKRPKKAPPKPGFLGTSGGTEVVLVLCCLNIVCALLLQAKAWLLYFMILVLNILAFQFLRNARKGDPWKETDEIPRTKSIRFESADEIIGADCAEPSKATGLLPKAGESLKQAVELTAEQRASEVPVPTAPHTWANGCGKHFSVRAKGYKTHKKKTFSGDPLYNCVAVDFVKVEARVNHMAADYILPEPTVQFSHPKVPQFFVVNAQLPTDAPTMMGEADGPGFQVVLYFEISQETANELATRQNMREATKLFEEYCTIAEEKPEFRGRFKVIGLVRNMEKMALPSFISAYNGKPVLINKSGRLFRGSNYLEMDVNVHNFSFMARKGLYSIQDKFILAYLNVGFVIEGRKDDEQPETLFGCCQINMPDLAKAIALDIFD